MIPIPYFQRFLRTLGRFHGLNFELKCNIIEIIYIEIAWGSIGSEIKFLDDKKKML
jgi:hypothetical protein